MGIADIEAAINSIPAQKQNLRKAFEDLQSYSSLASFTLQWKDIEDYFTFIKKSIDERFQKLKANDARLVPKKPADTLLAANVKKEQDMAAVEPRPELKSPCMKMDAKGLRSFIIGNRKDVQAMRSELGPALLSSPDPVVLVLDSFDGFAPSTGMIAGEVHAIRRGCLTILECFHGLALEIKPSDKKRAKEVAEECEKLIKDGKGHNAVVVLVFLQLVSTFGLVEFFAIDDLLDLLVVVSRRKCIVDLCRNSALEEMIPDLINKLNNMGKHLDSLKFVLAFNLLVKYPPASLFKAYIKESKRALQKGILKGKNSEQIKNAVALKEICALKEVIRAVEEYNLGSVYPRENFQKRIERLQKQRAEKKRVPTAIPSSNSNDKGQKHQHQPPNKRPRPSNSEATVLTVYPHSQNQTQLGLVDRAPYVGLASSYNLSAAPSLYSHGSANLSGNPTAPSFFSHGSASLSGNPTAPSLYSLGSASLSDNPIGFGGSIAPLKAYLYPSESLAGSVYYDRPLPYGGYTQSGLPAPLYNPSPYP